MALRPWSVAAACPGMRIDPDVEIPQRALSRHKAALNVVEYDLDRSLTRIAKATAARLLDRDHVAGLEHVSSLGVRRLAVDAVAPKAAGLAAVKAARMELRALAHERYR